MTDADVVVFAGDIHEGREGRKWIRRKFAKQPAIYVLGNHEYFRHAIPDLTETLSQETDDSHIHLLENSVVELNGITFLGCTLWTDFGLAQDSKEAMRKAEKWVGDYWMIQSSATNRPLRPEETANRHAISLAWLKGELNRRDPARTVVITHHAPSLRSIPPEHAESPLNGAFASNLDALIEDSGVPLWIHGHTHFNVDYMLGSTRVLTNQRGYPDQKAAGFNPLLMVEI